MISFRCAWNTRALSKEKKRLKVNVFCHDTIIMPEPRPKKAQPKNKKSSRSPLVRLVPHERGPNRTLEPVSEPVTRRRFGGKDAPMVVWRLFCGLDRHPDHAQGVHPVPNGGMVRIMPLRKGTAVAWFQRAGYEDVYYLVERVVEGRQNKKQPPISLDLLAEHLRAWGWL